MSSPTLTNRLCIFCRGLEPTNKPCPVLANHIQTLASSSSAAIPLSTGSGLSSQDDQLIRALQNQPSSLCSRCSHYNIINVFTKSQPLDMIQGAHSTSPTQLVDESKRYIDDMAPYRLYFGPLSSVVLTPSCPFCRLLYCILPKDVASDELAMHIEPYRSHIRQEGWETFPSTLKHQCAIFLGLATVWSPFTPVSDPFRAGEESIRFPMMTGPAICLDTASAPADRKGNNAKILHSMLDVSLLLKPLEHCQSNHGEYCHAVKPAELQTTRMVDVVERKVVPCPMDCDYIALSYVWGGVQPSIGALENKCLPQTIEDAITVTKELGRRYLWIDALCIDQSPNPSPKVLEEKMQQLGLMATIYGCATLTIVALTGKNSNAGLPGISVPRPSQVMETIDGHKLFTIPQYISLDKEMSEWSTRAWTLQEELLSRRLLLFTESQVDFSCLLGSVWEGMDTTTAFKEYIPKHPTQVLAHTITRVQPEPDGQGLTAEESLQGRMRLFDGVLQTYTSRRMTNEEDSLNAFLGMLTGFRRRLFPEGFAHGLPLWNYPAALGWMHDRNVKPRRRSMFPSWSWAGWEGTALMPHDLLNMFDNSTGSTADPDLDLRVVSLDGNELTVEGWVANLDIRTEPFSEVFIAEQEDSIASVMEGRSLHNNTLPTGRYDCLVVQRQCDRTSSRNPPRQKTFLIVLEWLGKAAQRRTMITVTSFAGCEFTQTKPELRIIRLV
ncbi:heterokaryon incompatibility protein-domain-containing protein [Pyrenochaeta sp. MPI-SDFR-AT-0127]|nr:heterokaryon incompatibility protein-domain-containing protein [Pyrenochaeta sp. MPI-SDFR-AT-0127]